MSVESVQVGFGGNEFGIRNPRFGEHHLYTSVLLILVGFQGAIPVSPAYILYLLPDSTYPRERRRAVVKGSTSAKCCVFPTNSIGLPRYEAEGWDYWTRAIRPVLVGPAASSRAFSTPSASKYASIPERPTVHSRGTMEGVRRSTGFPLYESQVFLSVVYILAFRS